MKLTSPKAWQIARHRHGCQVFNVYATMGDKWYSSDKGKMNEIIKAFSRFIGRDIPYLLGGASVIFSGAYLFGISFNEKIFTPYLVFICGVSYVVGFAIQEVFSFTGFTTTSLKINPNRFMVVLFERWDHRDWVVPDGFDAWEAYFRAYENLSKEQLDPIERIMTLQTFGHTMGANWLIASMVLLCNLIISFSLFHAILFFSVLVLSIILLLIGWMQGMEKILILYQLHGRLIDQA